MSRLLYILLLFAIAGAQAQQMPERSQVRKGNRQYNKGNYDTAIERYGRALQSAPTSFEATYDLGNALYKAERFDHAEKVLRQAAADSLRSETERAEAFYNLGNAQFRQKKLQEALESYRQSLRLNPSDMEAKYNYAYTKRLLDENKEGGGGNDKEQQEPQPGDQKQQQGSPKEEQGDEGEQNPEPDDQGEEGEPQPVPSGISEQEQEQMLDAIQAREDKTQEKLKEKQGVVVKGKKNW